MTISEFETQDWFTRDWVWYRKEKEKKVGDTEDKEWSSCNSLRVLQQSALVPKVWNKRICNWILSELNFNSPRSTMGSSILDLLGVHIGFCTQIYGLSLYQNLGTELFWICWSSWWQSLQIEPVPKIEFVTCTKDRIISYSKSWNNSYTKDWIVLCWGPRGCERATRIPPSESLEKAKNP